MILSSERGTHPMEGNMKHPIESIINNIQREIEYANDAIDEVRMAAKLDPLIPTDERAITYKTHKIDGVQGAVKHFERVKSMNRRRLSEAANHFLRSNGYNWDANPSKS